MHFSMSCREMHEGDNAEDKCSMLFHIFVQLQEGTNIKDGNKSNESNPEGYTVSFSRSFFPFKDFHLSAHLNIWGVEQGNPALLKILGGIVLIIALLALINYVNLTTAGYKLRLKETGVKKGLGAYRKTIIKEYILESVIMCIVAAYLSTFLGKLTFACLQ